MSMFIKFYDLMLYLTNNEPKPKKEWVKDEVKFDIVFLISGFVCIVSSVICFILSNIFPKLEMIAWGFEGIIWFIFLWDQIRHNREE